MKHLNLDIEPKSGFVVSHLAFHLSSFLGLKLREHRIELVPVARRQAGFFRGRLRAGHLG